MKKQLLFLVLFYLSTFLMAQKTITTNDFGEIGDSIIFGVDEAYVGEIYTGEKGEEITWDFSFLASNTFDTLYFINPDSTAGGKVANSNLVLRSNLIDTYWNNNTEDLSIKALGFEFDFSIIDTLDSLRTVYIEYNEGINQANYIMEYENVFSGSTEGTFTLPIEDTIPFDSTTSIYIDSARIIDDVSILDSINGYGVLILPNDTFECLRQEISLKHKYKIEILTPIFGFDVWLPLSTYLPIDLPNYNENYIRFWARGQQYPVLEFSMDTLFKEATETKFLYNPKEYIDGVKTHMETTISVYPNPAKNIINIDNLSQKNSDIIISNSLGKIEKQLHFTQKNVQIPITDLEKGIYFVSIRNDKEVKTLKIIKK